MSSFTHHFNALSTQPNQFVKYDQGMLQQFYGSADVAPFWVADMDFQVAPAITAELQRLVDRGVYAYEFNSSGMAEAICNWHQRRHGLTLNPAHFTQVPGVLSGLAMLVNEFTEQGDGVLIQTPAYHQFAKLIRSNGREVVENPLQLVNGQYQWDLVQFEQQLADDKVKMVLLCNPHNPTGRVWRKTELQQLVAIADKHEVLVVSDEIHADILLDGNRFTSAVALGFDKVITLLGSPAKTFGMNSISTGFIYSDNEALRQRISQRADALYLGHGNALTTFATIAAYDKGEQWLDELLTYLIASVDWVEQYLQAQLPQIKLFRPEGTYQIWLDMAALELTPQQLTELYGEAKFGLTPGNWFGGDYGQYARINIATPLAEIQQAFGRLTEALADFKPKPSCSGRSQGGCC